MCPGDLCHRVADVTLPGVLTVAHLNVCHVAGVVSDWEGIFKKEINTRVVFQWLLCVCVCVCGWVGGRGGGRGAKICEKVEERIDVENRILINTYNNLTII